ncbi:MAG: hypothetical protein ACI8PT_004048 [Gammaproteobacteria bacterium]|jgi:hypothetical protein
MRRHGFRAMARTMLEGVLGSRPDIIEHQLAHPERLNKSKNSCTMAG